MGSLGIVSHFFNEELLLPYWVKAHLEVADQVVMINHDSTDNSVEIIKEFAPHWKIVNTALTEFSAHQLEPEVQYWETQLSTKYKLALNSTEFIFDPNFKDTLDRCFGNYKDAQALGMRSFVMVDKEEIPLKDEPLWLNHTWGYLDETPSVRRWRYVHRAEHGHYQLGRHGCNLPHINMWGMYLQWYGWAPYPQCRERKLQIQTRIKSDRGTGLGFEHFQTPESLTEFYKSHLNNSYDLLENEDFKSTYSLYLKNDKQYNTFI